MAVPVLLMGMWNLFRKNERAKRIEAAADQLYAAICMSGHIEIPATLSKEDDTAMAVVRLRQKYPTAAVTYLQDSSVVLSRGNTAAVAMSDATHRILDAHGYFPSSELPVDVFFGAHEAMMRRNGRDVRVQTEKATRELHKSTAIEVK